MPAYEFFCLARPHLARTEQVALLKTAANIVLSNGGVLTDIRSFGEQPLAYKISRAKQQFNTAFAWQLSFISNPKVPFLFNNMRDVDEKILRQLVTKKDLHKPLPNPYRIKQEVLKKLPSDFEVEKLLERAA